MRGRTIRTLSRAALLALAVGVGVPAALAGLRGTGHDFTPGHPYDAVAASYGGLCRPCHERVDPGAGPPYGEDFPGGEAVMTDPTYVTVNDHGLEVGPRRSPSLAPAKRCLACHDGWLRTPLGDEHMPSFGTRLNGPNLSWAEGGAHNIWGTGQDSAWHPVEIHYPPLPEEQMWDPFQTMPVAADHNVVQDEAGRWWIVDSPDQPTVRLPLETDDADPGRAWITCTTCHDPHGRFPDEHGNFKRLNWPDLCLMCHRPTATASKAALAAERALLQPRAR